jgi:peptidyl-prolyl cis-trans isomerase SurA
MKNYLQRLLLLVGVLVLSYSSSAQQDSIYVLDNVIAIVGDEIVLKSELEEAKIQYRQEGIALEGNEDCFILGSLLTEKVFLHQARLDTIEVNDAMIEGELNRRIAMFSQQIGSEAALEDYFGKSIKEIKADFRDPMRNQMIVQEVQNQITMDVNVTPSDVSEYYNEIPKDSLPLMNMQVEFAQIVIFPKDNPKEVENVKQRLRGFIQEVREGEDFATLAVLYSDDPGSASKGGDLGMVPRGTMVPEFDEIAFQLSDGELSGVFETEFGYHIMQMQERRGEQYRARHILLKPKVTTEDMTDAKDKLFVIKESLKTDTLDWDLAVLKYSQDEKSFNNDGLVVNLMSGTPRFELSQLDPQAYVALENAELQQVIGPILYQTREGKEGYRLVKLVKKIEPHRANLTDDYQILQEAATAQAKQEATLQWLEGKINETYIFISEKYQDCSWELNWNKKSKK